MCIANSFKPCRVTKTPSVSKVCFFFPPHEKARSVWGDFGPVRTSTCTNHVNVHTVCGPAAQHGVIFGAGVGCTSRFRTIRVNIENVKRRNFSSPVFWYALSFFGGPFLPRKTPSLGCKGAGRHAVRGWALHRDAVFPESVPQRSAQDEVYLRHVPSEQ